MWKWALGAVVLVGCAHQPPPRPPAVHGAWTFAGLKGREVAVVLVDRDGLFAQSPRSLAAAREAVSQQLSQCGVMLSDGASHRLMFEISDSPTPDPGSMQQCARVVGRLEATEQAFLPTQSAMASRCAGKGVSVVTTGDPWAGLWAAGAAAVQAAERGPARERTEALFFALDEVLNQLDPTVRF
jgi:hypothetical protein